jgi:hypothetical protein
MLKEDNKKGRHMASYEKGAWIQLGIIAVTLTVYFLFITFGRLDSVSLAVFALAGFLGLARRKSRKGEVAYDERDRQIERQAILYSLLAFYLFMLVFSVVAGMTNGWDKSVPLWMVVQAFWVLSLVVWAIKAVIVILLYRRGAHA